jgi:gliding motility-associated-like protein
LLLKPTAKKDTIIRPFTIYDNKAVAGRDTITAMNEPVQLNAHGGDNVTFTWSPAIGLNNATKENPVATLDRDQLYRLDAITDKGCDSHTRILIKRFKGPELYIPSAFTPNADGLNDVLRVFPVGIKSFSSFAVYDRYGQKMFSTTDYNEGWDGRFKGKPVNPGTYVAYATAIDYHGIPMINKVSVVIIN